MIEVKKEEVVTFTIKLSGERAEQVRQWLTWSLAVWGQIQQHPMLEDEIFHNIKAVTGLVGTDKLNYDTAILIRNKLIEDK